MAAKNKGVIFLLIGCSLIIIAIGWYLYNIIEDKNAGKQAAEILEQFEKQTNEEDTPVITVNGDAFSGKLIIEKIAIELPIYDKWNYTRLKSAPCRYMGSIETNDIIIAGHNYKTHFALLNQLQSGDEVEFIDPYGKSHLYEVCEISLLDGTAVSDMQSGGWDLTLFTCTKSTEQRITVRCNRK